MHSVVGKCISCRAGAFGNFNLDEEEMQYSAPHEIRTLDHNVFRVPQNRC